MTPFSLTFPSGMDPNKVKRILTSTTTPLPQKRMTMSQAFGAYRTLMQQTPDPKHPGSM